MFGGDQGNAPPAESVKAGVDASANRLERERVSVQIRKQKRDERLKQRRRPNGVAEVSGASSGPLPQSQNIHLYVQGVMSDDPEKQLEATKNFRKLLSIEKSPPITEVTETGVVPRFVQFLQCMNNHQLQFEAAWALTNIASGTTEHTNVVVAAGAIPIFVQLLSSPESNVREQAVWALGNIAGDSHVCRDQVLRCGALPALLRQIKAEDSSSMQRNATWTLSNFCRGKPPPNFEEVKPALPKLAQLIYSEDPEVLADACWALSYLSDGSNLNIQAVIEAQVVNRCVELLMHQEPNVKTPALRTVGNIVTGDDLQTQVVVTSGALPKLLGLLSNDRKGIRKEACWTISNITAGNKDQIKAVIDANIIPILVDLLEKEEFDIKKEAAWAISNATSGGEPEDITKLVEMGCIPPFCNLLKVEHDPKIIRVTLEGLENILKVGQMSVPHTGRNPFADAIYRADGAESIERLQENNDKQVADKAIKIISTYFADENDDDEEFVPQSEGTHFGFGMPQQQQPPLQGGFNGMQQPGMPFQGGFQQQQQQQQGGGFPPQQQQFPGNNNPGTGFDFSSGQ